MPTAAKPKPPSKRVLNQTIREWVAAKSKLKSASKEVEGLKKTFLAWAGNKAAEFEASDGTKVPIREKSRGAYSVEAGTYLEVGLVMPD